MRESRGKYLAILALLATCGCVERRFVINTNIPGAQVYDEKGHPVGATPCDKEFTYYGKYRFTLVKDGYQTQVVETRVKAPWFEFPPLDFISENVLPFTIRDVRRLDYILQPAPMIPPEAVLREANDLRARGQTLQPGQP